MRRYNWCDGVLSETRMQKMHMQPQQPNFKFQFSIMNEKNPSHYTRVCLHVCSILIYSSRCIFGRKVPSKNGSKEGMQACWYGTWHGSHGAKMLGGKHGTKSRILHTYFNWIGTCSFFGNSNRVLAHGVSKEETTGMESKNTSNKLDSSSHDCHTIRCHDMGMVVKEIWATAKLLCLLKSSRTLCWWSPTSLCSDCNWKPSIPLIARWCVWFCMPSEIYQPPVSMITEICKHYAICSNITRTYVPLARVSLSITSK